MFSGRFIRFFVVPPEGASVSAQYLQVLSSPCARFLGGYPDWQTKDCVRADRCAAATCSGMWTLAKAVSRAQRC